MQQQSIDYVIDAVTGCWTWQKGTRNGYGRMRRGGQLHSAHIWYWQQAHGPVPEGLQLDHICHSNDKSCAGGFDCPHRRCVNPNHLEPVAHALNAQRGRLAKLTPKQVAEIKAQPWMPLETLADRYGVTSFNVAAIRCGKTWKAITPAEGFKDPRRFRLRGTPTRSRDTPLTLEEITAIGTAPRYYGSGRDLAYQYGVSDETISRIRRR